MEKIRIGITQGDTNGIGYEIIFKSFKSEEMFDLCTPVVYGSERIANYHRNALDGVPPVNVVGTPDDAQDGRLNLINVSEEECSIDYGCVTAAAGRQAQAALRRAMADWKEGLIDVIVTAPISKAAIHSDSFPYPGHTEFFEDQTNTDGLMILSNDKVRVALVTTHLPIYRVAEAVTAENIERSIRLLHQSLQRDYLISSPRIAVLGLNPHCGDQGTIGVEEEDIIIPLIDRLRDEGVPCFGPYAADGFFGEAMYQHFDAVLAMYHDQGLAPLKALGMDEGINFTAGLPVVRTSPDHGTAFDIAGQNLASAASMRQAIYAAIDIFRNRQAYDEAHQNPLPYNSHRNESRQPR